MNVIFIRHGDAGAYTHPDYARNLSELGKAQAEQTAGWLTQWAKTHVKPDLFIVSPYARARQTCDIVRQHFADVPVQVYEHITPNDAADSAIQGLDDIIENAQQSKPDLACVVIVCHMSIVAYMVSILTGDIVEGFGLAEARALQMEIFAPNLATQIDKFLPTI